MNTDKRTPPFWLRLADAGVFSIVQATGALAILHPKSLWLMVGVFLMLRAASLMFRPWRCERCATPRPAQIELDALTLRLLNAEANDCAQRAGKRPELIEMVRVAVIARFGFRGPRD